MNKQQAVSISHTLSKTSKMPGPSYSLPASACKTGSKLRTMEGTVCSKCYACKGAYGWPSTQKALEKRLASITHPDWEEAMVTLVTGHEFFRWHDSGDLQSLVHLDRIMAIARATPATKHWLPTKEIGMVRDYVKAHPERIPDNIVVRLSAPKVDSKQLASDLHEQVRTCRTVTKPVATFTCPAPHQGGKCGDCRSCWNPDIEDVAYELH